MAVKKKTATAKKKVAKKKTAKKKVVKKAITKSKKSSGKVAPPAYFLSLSVENVRCFGPKQTIDLSDGKGKPAQWTVILGDNNTGKTTLLQCFVVLEPTEMQDFPGFKHTVPQVFIHYNKFDLFRDKEKDTMSISGKACLSDKLKSGERVCPTDVSVLISSPADRKSGGYDWHARSEGLFDGLICYGYGASRIM